MKMPFNLPDDLATQLKHDATVAQTTFSAMLSSILAKYYEQPTEKGHGDDAFLRGQLRFIILLLQDDEVPISKQEILRKELERLWNMMEMQL